MASLPTWIRITAAAAAIFCAEGSAAARPVSASPQAAAAAVVNFLAPQLAVRGQRAVLDWRAAGDLVLSVQFGATPALGTSAVEVQRLGAAPLRGAPPAIVLHQVAVDGLAMGSLYYYRGTLSRAGAVVADTGVLAFETPVAFVRVRPVEIQMHKDGDHDIEVSVQGQELYDNDNEGEVYLEWNVKLRAEPGGWPWSPKQKGCYPGGGSIPTSFPGNEPGLGDGTQQPHPDQDASDVQWPNLETPDVGGGPDDWDPVGGCFAYSYSEPREVDDAKVGSGDTVTLGADDYPALEWAMPAGLPGEPGAVGQALAVDRDGDGEPDWAPEGGSQAEPESPCGDVPAGSFALVRIGVRGQEFDTAPGIGTTIGSAANLTQIINHDASESDTLCLDLRGEAQTTLFGVRAEDGSFQFTTWFEIALEYR